MSACSGMSNMIDELTSTVNRLNEFTHDRVEVEKISNKYKAYLEKSKLHFKEQKSILPIIRTLLDQNKDKQQRQL